MARRWEWLGDTQIATASADVDTAFPVLVAGDTDKGQTITRVVGTWAVQLVSASVTPRRFYMGLLLGDENAPASGMPSPINDPEADWIWHNSGTLLPHDVGGDYQSLHGVLDNRSMRIIRNTDQRLYMLVHAQGAPQNFCWGIRIGIKLV